ncbi:MAG: thioredoxin family protein [Chitinophagaceae bacterium]|nr:thioredoxin family protein [Chitinophagaceae bacterium]
MRYFIPLLLGVVLCMSAAWRTDFAQAKTDAAKQHKYIILKFSGSDWCIPCIRMKKKIFDQEVFQQYAKEKLILVNADFPRQKKNMPAEDVIKANDALAEQYNKSGHFPLTLLLDAEGKILKTWDGYKDMTPEEFVKEIKGVLHE